MAGAERARGFGLAWDEAGQDQKKTLLGQGLGAPGWSGTDLEEGDRLVGALGIGNISVF